ncbi:MAG: histidine--tRNA ligase [Bacteroidia bacterium]|nr:histidine--tRNA ligase [Bacteroidia bacterium]
MAKIEASIPKGTRDFAPEVLVRREYIFDTIKKVFRKYGYQPLETPAMENLNVLTGKYGEEGDRLIFKILNSGDFLSKVKGDLGSQTSASLTSQISEKALRYDLTVPFARFVSKYHSTLPMPFKRYQIQPVWRADNPQNGRFREFFQCDADVVGTDSLIYEAELTALYLETFQKLGIRDAVVLINNRKILTGIAELIGMPDKLTEICVAIDKLDKIGEDAVKAEMDRRGIEPAKTDQIFEILNFQGNREEKLAYLKTKFENCPTGLTGVKEMEEVFSYLNSLLSNQNGILFDLSLARGLDYYTGTIFEVKCPSVKIGSLGGGGRYADLTGIFGVKDMPGVGISFGADRIYLVMEEKGLFQNIPLESTQILVVNFSEATTAASLAALATLRAANIASEIYPTPGKLPRQFKYADRKNIPWTLIIGEDEMKSGNCMLKNMSSGEQSTCKLDHVIRMVSL